MSRLKLLAVGAVVALGSMIGCSSEVVVDPPGGGGSGGAADTAATGSGGGGGSGTGYGDFTCAGMCARFIAKFPHCYSELCLEGCEQMLAEGELKGCVPEAIACLERFPIDGMDCGGGCNNNQDWFNCLAGQ